MGLRSPIQQVLVLDLLQVWGFLCHIPESAAPSLPSSAGEAPSSRGRWPAALRRQSAVLIGLESWTSQGVPSQAIEEPGAGEATSPGSGHSLPKNNKAGGSSQLRAQPWDHRDCFHLWQLHIHPGDLPFPRAPGSASVCPPAFSHRVAGRSLALRLTGLF